MNTKSFHDIQKANTALGLESWALNKSGSFWFILILYFLLFI
jgi:hypothetical protein